MLTSRLFTLISAGLLIFTFFTVGGFWWPKYQSFDANVKALDQKNQEIKQKEEYFSTLRASDEKIGGYTEQLAKIDMAFPPNTEEGIAAFLLFLNGSASQNSTSLQETKWNAKSEKTSNFVKATFSNSGFAPYQKAKEFISQLYNNSRLVSLESFTIEKKKGQADEKQVLDAKASEPQDIKFDLMINFSKNPKSQTGN